MTSKRSFEYLRYLWPVLSIVLTSSATLAQGQTRARTVYAHSFSSDPTYSFRADDATACLQHVIDHAGTDVAIRVADMGSPWIINQPILAKSQQTLIFEAGVVLQAKQGCFLGTEESLVMILGKNDVIIQGERMPGKDDPKFAMRGDDYRNLPEYGGRSQQHRHTLAVQDDGVAGITRMPSMDIQILGPLTFTDSGGDGIYIGGKAAATSTNVTIRDVDCVRNHRNALTIINGNNVVVENSTFRDSIGTSPRAGISIEPNAVSNLLTGITIKNCRIEGNIEAGLDIVLLKMDPTTLPISVLVEDCEIKGSTDPLSSGLNMCMAGHNAPKGTITLRNIIVKDTQDAGLKIRWKNRDTVDLLFDGLWLENVARNGSAISPISIVQDHGDDVRRETHEVGGFTFRNVQVIDKDPTKADRPTMRFVDGSSSESLWDIHGRVYVLNPYAAGTNWKGVDWKGSVLDSSVDVLVTNGAARAVVNVADHGANGADTLDDTAAVNAAIAFRNHSGGALYFPRGTYLLDPASIASITAPNVWVRGEGGSSILKRNGTGTGAVLKTSSSDMASFEVSDLAFDLNLALSKDHSEAINVSNARRLRVEDCRFFSSTPYNNGNAHVHAVNVANVPSVLVQRSQFEGCQVTVNGSSATGTNGKDRGTVIRDNHFADARAHAILFKASGTSPTSGCLISGNIIRNIGMGGTVESSAIGFARESLSEPASVANDIQVVDNQIVGTWGNHVTGIMGIAAAQSRGWVIANNVLRNESATAGTVTAGVRVLNFDGTMKDVVISGNTVKHLASAGIIARGPCAGLRIEANHVEDTGGIVFLGTTPSGSAALIVGNTCVGNVEQGMHLRATSGNLLARVVGNELCHTYGGTSPAGLLLEVNTNYTLTADVFQNQFGSVGQAAPTQAYGVRHKGLGTFALRYFDNTFSGNISGASYSTPPPTSVIRRQNRGWD